MYVILVYDKQFDNWVAVGPRFGTGRDDWEAVQRELENHPGGIIAFLP